MPVLVLCWICTRLGRTWASLWYINGGCFRVKTQAPKFQNGKDHFKRSSKTKLANFRASVQYIKFSLINWWSGISVFWSCICWPTSWSFWDLNFGICVVRVRWSWLFNLAWPYFMALFSQLVCCDVLGRLAGVFGICMLWRVWMVPTPILVSAVPWFNGSTRIYCYFLLEFIVWRIKKFQTLNSSHFASYSTRHASCRATAADGPGHSHGRPSILFLLL